MNSQVQSDLLFIRDARDRNDVDAVLQRAAILLQIAMPGYDGHAEATLHLAWAYTQLRRYNEAKRLYVWLMDQASSLGLRLHLQSQRDYALFLHSTGKQDAAVELISQALSAAPPEFDEELHSSIAAAIATIMQEPRA